MHNSPPLGPILSQSNPVHTLTQYRLYLRLILRFPTHLSLRLWSLPSKLSDYDVLWISLSTRAKQPTHHILIYLITVISGDEKKLMKAFLMQIFCILLTVVINQSKNKSVTQVNEWLKYLNFNRLLNISLVLHKCSLLCLIFQLPK
jgi:hypothetical protein